MLRGESELTGEVWSGSRVSLTSWTPSVAFSSAFTKQNLSAAGMFQGLVTQIHSVRSVRGSSQQSGEWCL